VRGLAGKVAFVTGAGRGMGRAMAQRLAAEGAQLAVTDIDKDAAAAVAEALGNGAVAVHLDVTDALSVAAAVEEATAALGPIDILVNNAGMASRGHPVVDTDPAELPRLLAVNAFGPHRLAQLVLPAMRTRPRGDLVFISSADVTRLSANGAPYNMSKAAMEALAFTLAKEERPHGVHVNVVAPGLVATEMGERLVAAKVGTTIGDLDSRYPFGRVCTPDDVAGAVLFLVSGLAGYVTGQRIGVDGGLDHDPVLAGTATPS
jgi:3-oxoacyl-[acyl-carrier protein] reductase